MTVTTVPSPRLLWHQVCRLTDLVPDRGAVALIEGEQVAIFRLSEIPSTPGVGLFALDHLDPATGAGVIARGLLGSCGERCYVASPLRRHRYDLATGECLDDPQLSLRTWAVRTREGHVEVAPPGAARRVADADSSRSSS